MSDWFIGYATFTRLEEKGNEKEKEKGKEIFWWIWSFMLLDGHVKTIVLKIGSDRPIWSSAYHGFVPVQWIRLEDDWIGIESDEPIVWSVNRTKFNYIYIFTTSKWSFLPLLQLSHSTNSLSPSPLLHYVTTSDPVFWNFYLPCLYLLFFKDFYLKISFEISNLKLVFWFSNNLMIFK